MKNIFAVGTGPGDPCYLTLQAVDIMKNADIVFAPVNKGKHAALDTAREFVKEKKLELLDFPMGKVEKGHYEAAATKIFNLTPENGNGVFLTIGDPLIYSTFIYLMPYLQKNGADIRIISGMPSFVAAAGRAKFPLTVKGEKLILTDNLTEDICKFCDTAAVLKTVKQKENIIKLLKKHEFSYTYIKKAAMQGELILEEDKKSEILKDEDYLSLILAGKRRTKK